MYGIFKAKDSTNENTITKQILIPGLFENFFSIFTTPRLRIHKEL